VHSERCSIEEQSTEYCGWHVVSSYVVREYIKFMCGRTEDKRENSSQNSLCLHQV
jgi:hypothetical protein